MYFFLLLLDLGEPECELGDTLELEEQRLKN